jgi:ATP-dependent RNA helicase DOB1
VNVVIDDEAYGWGVLVSYKKKPGQGSGGEAGRLASLSGAPDYTLDVILACVDRHFDGEDVRGKDEDVENSGLLWRGYVRTCRPSNADDDAKVVSWRIFTVGLNALERVSAIKVVIPQDCTTSEARKKVGLLLTAAVSRFTSGIPLLDPVVDLGIHDEEFDTLLQRAEALTKRLSTHKLGTDFAEKDRRVLVQAFQKRYGLLEQAKALRDEAKACQSISMKEDLKKMKKVLKKLGHVDANGVIQTKGRTACEINTAHELVVVEMMFAGVFNDLSVEQCTALLSCMTFDERNKDDGDPASGLKSNLSAPFYKLQETARTVAKVEIACGIVLNEDEFVDKFNPGM